MRTRQATKRSIRRVASIWTILNCESIPGDKRASAAFMRTRVTAAGGCAAGHVPPSPILIRMHTSFRGVAKQCLSCVQINHRAAAVHQIALWSLATIPIRGPRRVRMFLDIIDLLALGFVYDRDMSMAWEGCRVLRVQSWGKSDSCGANVRDSG